MAGKLVHFEILAQDMARLNALNEHFSALDRLTYL